MLSRHHAVLTYKAFPEYNVGDYIQSLAAAQYLPPPIQYINREKLNDYSGDPIKMILNGWFMHHPECWPPSPKIEPLVTSFHLNSQARSKMLNEEGINWFKQHQPIGCRDQHTLETLNAAGISTHLTGCLTTTFQNKYHYRTNDIYFADVLFRVPDWSRLNRQPRELFKAILNGDIFFSSKRNRLLQKLFDSDLINKAIQIEHYHSSRHTEKERFAMAENFLEKYATAKLVITSRLHCALPCLAFGTPVIFVDCGFSKEYDKCRLEGITSLFNTITIDEDENITANFPLPPGRITENISLKNPETFRKSADALRNSCESFMNSVTQTI